MAFCLLVKLFESGRFRFFHWISHRQESSSFDWSTTSRRFDIFNESSKHVGALQRYRQNKTSNFECKCIFTEIKDEKDKKGKKKEMEKRGILPSWSVEVVSRDVNIESILILIKRTNNHILKSRLNLCSYLLRNKETLKRLHVRFSWKYEDTSNLFLWCHTRPLKRTL